DDGEKLDFGGGLEQEVALLDAVAPHVSPEKAAAFVTKRFGPLVSTKPEELWKNVQAAESPVAGPSVNGTIVNLDELVDENTGRLREDVTRNLLGRLNPKKDGGVHFYSRRADTGTLRQELERIAARQLALDSQIQTFAIIPESKNLGANF